MSPVIFPLFIPHLLPVSTGQGGSVGGQNDTNKIKRGLRWLQSAAGTAGVTVTLNGRIDGKRHQEANYFSVRHPRTLSAGNEVFYC